MIHKNKNITILSHLLVWFLLFTMPYILSYEDHNMSRVIRHFWIPMVFYAVIFYLNYFVLVDRFLFSKKALVFIGINLVLIVLLILLKDQIQDAFFQESMRKRAERNNGSGPPIKLSIYIQLLSYTAPLLFSIAVKSTKRWITTEAERKEADNFKLQSDLKHLHYQLQPHFFFNSLNNIYSMVDVSPDQAKKSIHSLSKLMRYLLYETNLESTTLSKEIDFLKKYIDLMKLRVSEKTTVNYAFPTEETGIKIAPLLFISLIENAFKHGISGSKPSEINIAMSCEQQTVLFTIENNNFPKTTTDKSGSGIGIQNLKKRLELLYSNKFSFETALKDERFLVSLKIETH